MTPPASFPLAAALIAVTLSPAAAQDEAAGQSGFRQGVAYRIEAQLDEAAQVLRGRARLRYTNNAPVPLDTIYVHQYLNAFRPHSAWARRELEFGQRRFQDLGPEEHGFERFTRVTAGGASVAPAYPGAPDSTVAALPLPRPVPPGSTIDVVMDWEARPSTVPRRQGRRGRHWDFAQWYPRVAVYGTAGSQAHPLLPQGEFFGEFATDDVTLDLPADQIVGATGVPVDGDPGWEGALGPLSGAVRLRRDAYGSLPPDPLNFLPDSVGPSRKRVRWRAERVHHFAWSADPDFLYEGGAYRDVAIHVLYPRGDLDWDLGTVVRRTIRALAWLETVFGPYPYPQLTVLHRIESGGTEFPMLVMNGSAGQGLITHEVTHQYAHGLLANNEWRDAWLDEGLTTFVTNWFFEEHGREGIWRGMLEDAAEWDPEVRSQPVATPSAEFRDFRSYGTMSYSKGGIVFYMLREYLGRPAFRRVLQTYDERHRFTHVTEADFRRAAEDVSGKDLGWFFEQWLHTTATLDYRVGEVTVQRTGGGAWRTRVEVLRDGEAWMPVTLRAGEATRVLDSREPRQVVEVTTRRRPDAVELDPERLLLDADPSNNRRAVPEP